MMVKNQRAEFFYIAGCDGTGKSTQAKLLVEYLRKKGLRVKHVWLRFPFFFSLPFLLYARMRRMSWYEKHGGKRFGYWNFQHSWIMQVVFPWILLADSFFIACYNIYIPLSFGTTLVCERFIIDILADLTVANGNSKIIESPLGEYFFRLLPIATKYVILEVDPVLIRERRTELVWDYALNKRYDAFKSIVNTKSIPVIENKNPIGETFKKVTQLFGV